MDLDVLAEAWRDRFARERVLLSERTERARAAAKLAARALADEFGATDVWLFGSLAWGAAHDRSDVDLAVRGIAPGRYFPALARACEIVGGPVDLVTLESCADGLRRRVEREGVRLDGR